MWLYPVTESETTRYRVFKDLWEKGYYLTSGCKFGGDFLVYPGKYMRTFPEGIQLYAYKAGAKLTSACVNNKLFKKCIATIRRLIKI